MSADFPETDFKRYCAAASICFAVGFALVWLWVLKAPMYYMDQEYPIWIAKEKMAREGLAGKLIVMGDSRPLPGMIPARIGQNVVNLALPGSTSIENYYFAREIVSGPQLPKAVIISFSPIHFVEAPYFWTRSVEFGFFHCREIDEVRTEARALGDAGIFGKMSPFDLDARLKGVLYDARFPSYYFPALLGSRLYRRHATNMEMLSSVFAARGQVYIGKAHGSTAPDLETGLQSFVPSKLQDDYMDRLLSLLQSKNIPVYFLDLPHNAASDRLYFPGLKEAFVAHLYSFTARHPNFHILGEPFPVYPSECFADHAHMNELGATRWSDYVVQLLNGAHVPGGPFGIRGVQAPQ